MKFTWEIELKNGKMIEYDLSEGEIKALERGVITFQSLFKRIEKEINEEDVT